MSIPSWALWLSFALHMLATVVWVGGLAAIALFVLPLMQRSLNSHDFAGWLGNLNKRLDPIGWFSLGLLTFTGLMQMDSNPNYAGLLAVGNPWSQAIFLKHVAFIGMIAVSAYSTWSVAPALHRAALRRTKQNSDAEKGSQVLQRLIYINLFLGLLILLFTALARIS